MTDRKSDNLPDPLSDLPVWLTGILLYVLLIIAAVRMVLEALRVLNWL